MPSLLCVRSMRDWSMFSFICALPSPASAGSCLPLFGWFTGVGSEVAHQISTLATVRRPNRACSYPAHGFHEDSTVRRRKEGISPTRFNAVLFARLLMRLGKSHQSLARNLVKWLTERLSDEALIECA
jgi:hypothetical protein